MNDLICDKPPCCCMEEQHGVHTILMLHAQAEHLEVSVYNINVMVADLFK